MKGTKVIKMTDNPQQPAAAVDVEGIARQAVDNLCGDVLIEIPFINGQPHDHAYACNKRLAEQIIRDALTPLVEEHERLKREHTEAAGLLKHFREQQDESCNGFNALRARVAELEGQVAFQNEGWRNWEEHAKNGWAAQEACSRREDALQAQLTAARGALENSKQCVQAFLDMVNIIQKFQALPILAILETAQNNCPIILAQINKTLAAAPAPEQPEDLDVLAKQTHDPQQDYITSLEQQLDAALADNVALVEQAKDTLRKCWSASSKLDSQISRNPDLPSSYRTIAADAWEAMRKLYALVNSTKHPGQALPEKITRLEGELRAIDSLLDRRDALEGLPNRIAKIQKCIEAAKLADPNDKRLDQLTRLSAFAAGVPDELLTEGRAAKWWELVKEVAKMSLCEFEPHNNALVKKARALVGGKDGSDESKT